MNGAGSNALRSQFLAPNGHRSGNGRCPFSVAQRTFDYAIASFALVPAVALSRKVAAQLSGRNCSRLERAPPSCLAGNSIERLAFIMDGLSAFPRRLCGDRLRT